MWARVGTSVAVSAVDINNILPVSRPSVAAEPPRAARDVMRGLAGVRSALGGANEETRVTIEHASMRTVEKPWGRTDLRPWSEADATHGRIGEIWYERADPAANEPSLLLKLLFTCEPLSIQVHPGDAFAHSIGEARGKSEAWYLCPRNPALASRLGSTVA